jgi:hypothetical protein
MMPFSLAAGDIFPVAVRGWSIAAPAAHYTPENLHEYIDGASELYISYGFVELVSCRYEKPGQPEMVVDFFDMGRPERAFGIFAHSQEKPEKTFGQDSEYLDGSLRFWKGRFYVSLLSSPETPDSRDAVMELGRQLAERLPFASERPRILSLLPPAGLLHASIRYFFHHAWQNTYVFIAGENILGIGPGCEAVLAKYAQGRERPVVLLVAYPDRDAARRAFSGLGRAFGMPTRSEKAIRLDDNKFFVASLDNKVVAAVWHGGGAKEALALLSAVRSRVSANEG